MSLTTTNRTAMDTAPDIIITADTVEGPGQGNWTYETYETIPDNGKRYQVVNGVLFMSPAPNKWHQKAVGRIFRYLAAHIEETGMGEVYIAPFDVELAPNVIVQPDVMILLKPHLEKATDKRIIGAPDLVVEISSPGTVGFDRRQKQDAYALAGVPEYWIVDHTSHTVELLTLKNSTYHSLGIFQGQLTLPSTIVPDFPVSVEQFFL